MPCLYLHQLHDVCEHMTLITAACYSGIHCNTTDAHSAHKPQKCNGVNIPLS